MIITREQQEKLVSDYNKEKYRTISEHCAFIDGMNAMWKLVNDKVIQEFKERKQFNI